MKLITTLFILIMSLYWTNIVFVHGLNSNGNVFIPMAKEIAKEIEDKVSYPGEVKVNVIRESRAVEFAK